MKHPNLTSFGNRLKEAREELRLTQEQLAKMVGTNKSMISNYEQAESDPRMTLLPELAEALKVSLNWLISGIGPKRYEVDDALQYMKDNRVLAKSNGDLSDSEKLAVAEYIEYVKFKRDQQTK